MRKYLEDRIAELEKEIRDIERDMAGAEGISIGEESDAYKALDDIELQIRENKAALNQYNSQNSEIVTAVASHAQKRVEEVADLQSAWNAYQQEPEGVCYSNPYVVFEKAWKACLLHKNLYLPYSNEQLNKIVNEKYPLVNAKDLVKRGYYKEGLQDMQTKILGGE